MKIPLASIFIPGGEPEFHGTLAAIYGVVLSTWYNVRCQAKIHHQNAGVPIDMARSPPRYFTYLVKVHHADSAS
jgi:hypothetical protein